MSFTPKIRAFARFVFPKIDDSSPSKYARLAPRSGGGLVSLNVKFARELGLEACTPITAG